MSDSRSQTAAALRAKAERYIRLASSFARQDMRAMLVQRASECFERALKLEEMLADSDDEIPV